MSGDRTARKCSQGKYCHSSRAPSPPSSAAETAAALMRARDSAIPSPAVPPPVPRRSSRAASRSRTHRASFLPALPGTGILLAAPAASRTDRTASRAARNLCLHWDRPTSSPPPGGPQARLRSEVVREAVHGPQDGRGVPPPLLLLLSPLSLRPSRRRPRDEVGDGHGAPPPREREGRRPPVPHRQGRPGPGRDVDDQIDVASSSSSFAEPRRRRQHGLVAGPEGFGGRLRDGPGERGLRSSPGPLGQAAVGGRAGAQVEGGDGGELGEDGTDRGPHGRV